MVIFTYSNILLSVSLINIANMRVVCSQERPLRLFEVLARNRQSAVGRGRRTRSAREQPTRMFTIPPRQQLSSPTRLAYEAWRVTRARIRIRIRIIAHILNKAAAPSYYSSREKHRTNTHTSSTKISSLYTHTRLY